MAEKRMLSRRASKSKKLATVSYQAEAFYYRALPYTDDAGRLTTDPEDFRAEILPLGKKGKPVPLSQVEAAIQELFEVGLVGFCSCGKKRCMEYTDFLEIQVLKKDRLPQINCKDPVGFHWNTLEPTESNGIPNRREEKLREGRGNAREAAPPEVQELIHKAQKIKGWNFTEDQDAEFFPRLLANFPKAMIAKTIEDLRVYQEKPAKKYTNLHATLRNWCKLERERHPDNGSISEGPTDDLGRAMIPLNGKHYSQKEIDMMIRDGQLARTAAGYQLL